MIDSGTLTDYTSPYSGSSGTGGDIEAELDKVALNQSVDSELSKMKSERKVVQ